MENVIALAAGLVAFATFYGIVAVVRSYIVAGERVTLARDTNATRPIGSIGSSIGGSNSFGDN